MPSSGLVEGDRHLAPQSSGHSSVKPLGHWTESCAVSFVFALALPSEHRGQVVAGQAVGRGGGLTCLPFWAARADTEKSSLAAVSYTHLTLPTTGSLCRSRWSPYH